MTIGSELQTAREERGITLRDISDRTKIRVPVLRAIESDDFANAPGGVIMRGFLKIYAREVGIDPAHIARRFEELQGADAKPASGAAEADVTPQFDRRIGKPRVPVAAIVLIGAAAVLAAGYTFWTGATRGRANAVTAAASTPTPAQPPDAPPAAPPPEKAVETVEPARPAPPPATGETLANAAAVAPTPPATTPPPGALRVDVRATEASWLAASADGTQVAYRVLNPGDHVSLTITTEAVLRIGMPGNVTVSINDVAVKPFARPGTPTTLRITPANYRDLLAP